MCTWSYLLTVQQFPSNVLFAAICILDPLPNINLDYCVFTQPYNLCLSPICLWNVAVSFLPDCIVVFFKEDIRIAIHSISGQFAFERYLHPLEFTLFSSQSELKYVEIVFSVNLFLVYSSGSNLILLFHINLTINTQYPKIVLWDESRMTPIKIYNLDWIFYCCLDVFRNTQIYEGQVNPFVTFERRTSNRWNTVRT